MKRTRKGKPKTKNVTHAKLAGLPFKSARACKEAQDAILMHVWQRMEESKTIHELLERDEYSFWAKEFEKGLVCVYGENGGNNLVRVSSDGGGLKITINKILAEATPTTEKVVGALVRAMSESFIATYFKAKGFLPSDGQSVEEKAKPRKS